MASMYQQEPTKIFPRRCKDVVATEQIGSLQAIKEGEETGSSEVTFCLEAREAKEIRSNEDNFWAEAEGEETGSDEETSSISDTSTESEGDEEDAEWAYYTSNTSAEGGGGNKEAGEGTFCLSDTSPKTGSSRNIMTSRASDIDYAMINRMVTEMFRSLLQYAHAHHKWYNDGPEGICNDRLYKSTFDLAMDIKKLKIICIPQPDKVMYMRIKLEQLSCLTNLLEKRKLMHQMNIMKREYDEENVSRAAERNESGKNMEALQEDQSTRAVSVTPCVSTHADDQKRTRRPNFVIRLVAALVAKIRRPSTRTYLQLKTKDEEEDLKLTSIQQMHASETGAREEGLGSTEDSQESTYVSESSFSSSSNNTSSSATTGCAAALRQRLETCDSNIMKCSRNIKRLRAGCQVNEESEEYLLGQSTTRTSTNATNKVSSVQNGRTATYRTFGHQVATSKTSADRENKEAKGTPRQQIATKKMSADWKNGDAKETFRHQMAPNKMSADRENGNTKGTFRQESATNTMSGDRENDEAETMERDLAQLDRNITKYSEKLRQYKEYCKTTTDNKHRETLMGTLQQLTRVVSAMKKERKYLEMELNIRDVRVEYRKSAKKTRIRVAQYFNLLELHKDDPYLIESVIRSCTGNRANRLPIDYETR